MASQGLSDPIAFPTTASAKLERSPRSSPAPPSQMPELVEASFADSYGRSHRTQSLAMPAVSSRFFGEQSSGGAEASPMVAARRTASRQESDGAQRVASILTGESGRKRSNSLPLTNDALSDYFTDSWHSPSSSGSVSPSLSSDDKLPPLSYHHVITLHQLNLPRPHIAHSSSRSALAQYQSAPTSQLVVPSLEPPITLASLKELDLVEVMRNPQLRHDVVFDPRLMFRPNFEGERGRRKREAAERYWEALSAEVQRGCRCATWAAAMVGVLPCVCDAVGISSSAVDALLHGGRRQAELAKSRKQQSPRLATAPALASRLPSRVPSLIEELRLIMISLLPSPTSTKTGISADEISSVLDADLISQQAEHGVLDVIKLARFLGATLKLHCAPMRDEAVDAMVDRIEAGQVAEGLRQCFELLELMKLDIANHQLRTLRPFLLETAADYELKNLYDVYDRVQDDDVPFEKTRTWFDAALRRTSERNIPRLVCDGILELAFNPSCIAAAAHAPGMAAPSSAQVPETLHLDVARLQAFHAGVTDLTIVCMLLLLYRQLSSSTPGCQSITDEDLDLVRYELWALIAQPSPPPSPVRPTSRSSSRDGSLCCSSAGETKLDNVEWRECLRDAALQVARRVKNGQTPGADEQSLVIGWVDTQLTSKSELFGMVQRRLRIALTELLDDQRETITSGDAALLGFNAVQRVNVPSRSASCPAACVRRDAPVTSQQMASSSSSSGTNKRRRRAESSEVDDQLIYKRLRIEAPAADPSACLAPLMSEVRTLGERIAKVAAVHLRVYNGWYSALLSAGAPPTLIVQVNNPAPSPPLSSAAGRSNAAHIHSATSV